MQSSYLLTLIIGLATARFNAPIYEFSEEARFINHRYHKFIDKLVWTNVFKWGNCSSGQLNLATLISMEAKLTAYLSKITTPTFRQCDRLGTNCFQCENGAANVSAASIRALVATKLYGQDNNIFDIVAERVSASVFTLDGNTRVPVFTASLDCRANSSCFPCNFSQTILGFIQGPRQLTFNLISTSNGLRPLIDRINTGSRYIYYSSAETRTRVDTGSRYIYYSSTENEARILNVNQGQEYVPEIIMNDFSVTGIFCVLGTNVSKPYYCPRKDVAAFLL